MKKLMILLVVIVGILFVNIISFANNNWSEWQDEAISSSDTIEVETRQVPSSYIMVSFVCGVSGYPRGYYSWNKGSFRCDYSFEWTASEFDNAIVYHEGDYFDFHNGTACDGLIGGGGNAYVRDSDWYIPCYLRETKYKTQYRYRNIENKKVDVIQHKETQLDKNNFVENTQKSILEKKQIVNEEKKVEITQSTNKNVQMEIIEEEKTVEIPQTAMPSISQEIIKEEIVNEEIIVNIPQTVATTICEKIVNDEIENEETTKRKSKGKSMNGGAKVWNGTSDNQNTNNTINYVEESNEYIIIDEEINGDNVKTIIPNLGNVETNIYSIDNLFNKTSYVFNKMVGLFAAKLCKEAYNVSDLIQTLYNTYGFSDVKTYNYTSDDSIAYIDSNCFTIGHREISKSNKKQIILCITARGSKFGTGELMGDWVKYDWLNNGLLKTDQGKFLISNLLGSDFLGEFLGNNMLGVNIYDNIFNFYEQIRIGMENYFAYHPELKDATNLKILITGHSLGGGAANLYAAKLINDIVTGNCLNKNLQTKDIFTYTFGAIKVIDCNSNANLVVGYENIYNIYNHYDSFGPNGGLMSNFQASSPYQKFGKTLEYQDERYNTDRIGWENHLMENYIDALNNYDFTRTNNSAQNVIISSDDTANTNNSINNNSNNSNNNNNNNNNTINNNYDSIIDLTSLFNGRLVKIFSKETNHYISDEEGTIHADGEGGEGVFITQTTSDGWVGFKRQNGNWLSVQDGGYVRAEGRNLSSWECFKVYQYKDNMYLLSQKENKYVQVINDGIQITNPLQAARKIEDGLEGATWERFAIVFVDGK